MRVRTLVFGKPVVLGQFCQRFIHGPDELGRQQVPSQFRHGWFGLLPAKYCLEGWVGQKGAEFAKGPIKYFRQVTTQWDVGESQATDGGQLRAVSKNR